MNQALAIIIVLGLYKLISTRDSAQILRIGDRIDDFHEKFAGGNRRKVVIVVWLLILLPLAVNMFSTGFPAKIFVYIYFLVVSLPLFLTEAIRTEYNRIKSGESVNDKRQYANKMFLYFGFLIYMETLLFGLI